MKEDSIVIDVSLVRRLIASQFPQSKAFSITPVATSGWDNRTFHLGQDMSVRLPSAADYELQVEKEHEWLPKLASALPLPISIPLALGKPECGYPWKWSIYRWLQGEAASSAKIADLSEFAIDLANFLTAFQRIDAKNGPQPGLHSFYRGGSLSFYDNDTRCAIANLKDKIDVDGATNIWEAALSTSWKKPPVWVHGDISLGNLLVKEGKLCAVIDFGQLASGDPACDFAITWTLFYGKSREVFQKILSLDKDTWARARGWTLWKALVVASGFTNPNNTESKQCRLCHLHHPVVDTWHET
jgi:aminoglycoside phosphotransferase (APT) family kinase protein